ncbi:hypothetical protein H1R20_g14542, partial [Candolleomyces eurysporus]
MAQQQQSAAAAYQQPLPPTPPAGDVGGTNTGSPNTTGTVATPLSSTPASSQPVNKPQPGAPGQTPSLHPEIRSVVGLTIAHAHKIYFSGPLVRRIERQADGQRPHKDEGWTEVWAQLGGTTLSIWDMKEVQEASRQGKEVPPAYVNVTDAFIQVLGSVTVPATANSPPKRYTNVLTLNTAGSNLLLFSCPSTGALISWASALRLSAWEKSRLEEIYTAHLIRVTLSSRDYPTSLFRGKLEGWAQIRIAGQTDWKRVWVSISEGASPDSRSTGSPTPAQQAQVQTIGGKKRRMSSLFTKEHNEPHSTLPDRATIAMYSGMKPKEKKKPLLTMTNVSQAFAVYPERPELIPRSSLIKLEGTFGDEELAMSMKSREGWILIMPSMEQLNQQSTQSNEMLKWVIALHDAFKLYGRPQGWTWDPRDPASLMFGYPVGPQKEPRLPAPLSKDSQSEQHDAASNAPSDNALSLKQPHPSVPPHPAPVLQPSTSSSSRNDFVNEAGALFFMQQNGENNHASTSEQAPRQEPVSFDDDDSDVDASKAPSRQITAFGSDSISLKSSQDSSRHAPIRQNTPMAFTERPSASNADVNDLPTAKSATNSPQPPPSSGLFAESRLGSDRGYANRSTLGRKPSGARAPQPVSKGFSGQVAGYASSSQTQLLPSQYEDSEGEDAGDSFNSRPKKQQQSPETKSSSSMAPAEVSTKQPLDAGSSFDDGNDEVLAALAYLDVNESAQKSVAASDSIGSNGGPLEKAQPPPPPVAITESSSGSAFKSSFAPSKQAEERKKKAQAQQAALQAAVNKPGRANGKKGKSQTAGGWAESSDEEEEEEEEEEDDEVDSDGEPAQAIPPRMQQQQQQQQQQAAIQAQQQSFVAPQSSVYPSVGGGDMQSAYSHLRPPRTLPQPPMGSRPSPNDFDGQHVPRRQPSDQYLDNTRRTYYEEGPQIRNKPEGPAPGAARQTVWSQVLEAGRPGANFHPPNEPSHPVRDTFVQLEPSETMTKAFTPQGLLSAGMQDKQDRSAKRQEELARETGASLINVPNKPPPPQTGLLGAISAHERERKREGGVGAALTEREREKRVAEERQRRFDEQQRQQLDQMQQGGSMYGAPYGFNPMMNPMMMGMNPMMGMAPMMTGQPGMNPMMTGGGLNPMMTGGGMNPMMGYGMMPGFNPQHLFAAQQAAQAYQNAMMAFSVAGSQVGGDGGNGGGANPQQPMNPMMGQGNMGFDPRMSMNLMGMGMMGGMGMGPPMMNPTPLGAQNTGMSQFDPRAGDQGQLGLTPPGNQNLSTPNSQFGSGNNSPIGRGSSPLRQSETPQRSRPTSPGA